MERQKAIAAVKLHFTYGSFEGFNFRSQSAIERNLTAEDVVNWDHDQEGEAEFWPAGDHPEVKRIFPGNEITGAALVALDSLLKELGGDQTESFLRISYLVRNLGCDIYELTAPQVEDLMIHIFIGESFCDVRKEAAYELFELYYPEAYAMWEKCMCDGLIFHPDSFLDSPQMSTDEVRLGDKVALLVVPE